MLKAKPRPDYPPEEGRYVRAKGFSPVAVVIILTCEKEKMPHEIKLVVRTGIEAGPPFTAPYGPKTSASKGSGVTSSPIQALR